MRRTHGRAEFRRSGRARKMTRGKSTSPPCARKPGGQVGGTRRWSLEEGKMSTATIALSNLQTQRSPAHTALIYLKEAKYEFLKYLRLRVYTLSVLSFPIMFYILFGLVLNSNAAIGAIRVPTYLIATYGTFGVMGVSLFGTAAGLASDRGLGWLEVKRASPMLFFAYFAAKVITSLVF